MKKLKGIIVLVGMMIMLAGCGEASKLEKEVNLNTFLPILTNQEELNHVAKISIGQGGITCTMLNLKYKEDTNTLYVATLTQNREQDIEDVGQGVESMLVDISRRMDPRTDWENLKEHEAGYGCLYDFVNVTVLTASPADVENVETFYIADQLEAGTKESITLNVNRLSYGNLVIAEGLVEVDKTGILDFSCEVVYTDDIDRTYDPDHYFRSNYYFDYVDMTNIKLLKADGLSANEEFYCINHEIMFEDMMFNMNHNPYFEDVSLESMSYDMASDTWTITMVGNDSVIRDVQKEDYMMIDHVVVTLADKYRQRMKNSEGVYARNFVGDKETEFYLWNLKVIVKDEGGTVVKAIVNDIGSGVYR